eukprot:g2560.t1
MNSSRLFVRNLPSNMDEKGIREHFATHGDVTDVRLVRAADGRSKRFCFVGFKDAKQAEAARAYFDKSYFRTSKIDVDIARPYERKKKDGMEKKKTKMEKKRKKGKKQKEQQNAKRQKGGEYDKFLSLMQPDATSIVQDELEDDKEGVEGEQGEDDIVKSSDDDGDNDGNDHANDMAFLRAKSEAFVEAEKNKEEEEEEEREEREEKDDDDESDVAVTGRLFVRNLPFSATEADLRELFEQYGPIAEAHVPVDDAHRSRGFAYILFVVPENAVAAMRAVDGSIWQGRLLHVLPAHPRIGGSEGGQTGDAESGGESDDGEGSSSSSFKRKRDMERKRDAGDERSWSSLYVRSDAVVGALARKFNMSESEILGIDGEDKGDASMAVRVALGETQIIAETRAFLEAEGVDASVLEKRGKASKGRSKTILLVKNLPHDTDKAELQQMFRRHGDLERFVMPQSKVFALVEFAERKDASRAFAALAYKRYKRVPIYLEWAPVGVIKEVPSSKKVDIANDAGLTASQPEQGAPGQSCTLYVKNINWNTTEDGIQRHFRRRKCACRSVSLAKGKGKGKTSEHAGFGFIEFSTPAEAERALRSLQGTVLDGHALVLAVSARSGTGTDSSAKQRSSAAAKKPSTKMLVKNLAFEASRKDLRQLFGAYGQLKSVRIPRKMDGTHRGFAFVDFLTKQEAQSAFTALKHSHLYGRHMVLEWAEDAREATV